jgi:hypothetical protein
MVFARHLALFAAVTFALTGCRFFKQKPERDEGPEYFRRSTGLDLPASSKCLDAKVFPVLFVGDTYYLKIEAPKGFAGFLDANFERGDQADGSLEPPPDWAKSMPFWDQAAISRATRFGTKKIGEIKKDLHISAIAYDEATGIAYFVGEECLR